MWLALSAEIAVEFRSYQPEPQDLWDMYRPTRNEAARQQDAREATRRKIAQLHALGRTREARKLESYVRAWARRKA